MVMMVSVRGVENRRGYQPFLIPTALLLHFRQFQLYLDPLSLLWTSAGLKKVVVATLLYSASVNPVGRVGAERLRSSSGVHSERGPGTLPILPGYLSLLLHSPVRLHLARLIIQTPKVMYHVRVVKYRLP